MEKDIKKIMALRKAGWKTERIAAEVHMELDAVDKIISEYVETEKNEIKSEQGTEGKGITLISITPEQMKDIYEKAAAIGAKEALKVFGQEQKKEYNNRRDSRLMNTKLLLRNYHMLKEHAKNSVFGRTQMEESALDILESMMTMYNNEVIIESIKRSATRTGIIVTHIETMFGLYQSYCQNAVNRDIELRRYEVLWDMYMAEDILSAEDIAKKQNISIRNVYKDIKIATERLSALIFGVDGLNVH